MRSLKRPSRTPHPKPVRGVSRAHRGLPEHPSRFIEASLALALLSPGQTAITEAFNLAPVRWLLYAVGPIYPAPG